MKNYVGALFFRLFASYSTLLYEFRW